MKFGKNLGVFLVLLLLLTIIPLTVWSVKNLRFETRKKASEPIPQEDKKRTVEIDYIPGEILVKFKAKPNLKKQAGKAYSLTQFPSINSLLENFRVDDTRLLFKTDKNGLEKIIKIKLENKVEKYLRPRELQDKFPFQEESEEFKLITRLKSDPNVEYAEPNYIYKTLVTPNDQLYSQQWHLPKIQAEDGWNITTGQEITIAVIDTGIDYLHEDLEGRIWQNQGEIPNNGIDDDNNGYIDDTMGWDFVNIDSPECDPREDCLGEDNNPKDLVGHGTHVAGIIAASSNNNKGITGICWNCKIMNLRAGWKTINGEGGVDIESVIKALVYATDNGAKITNMSFGGPGYSQSVNDSLRYSYEKNVLLVASAGNSGNDMASYPATSQYVISVAATNNSDQKANFSTYGPNVDIAAPGVNILSLRANGTDMYGGGAHIVNDKYYLASGTSMSAPIVSGVFGLIKSLHPSWTNRENEKFLRLTVDPVSSDFEIGYGRINLNKAVTTSLSAARVTLLSPGEYGRALLPLGQSLEIKGEAMGAGFKLEFGEGVYPTQWQEIIKQNTPVNIPWGGLIHNWQTNSLGEKLYTLKLTVFDDQGGSFYALSRVEFYDPTLGWSSQLPHYSSAPNVIDLNKDGQKEIIISSGGNIDGKLNFYVFRNNGSAFFAQNPIVLEGGEGFTSSPAIGDINGDDQPEIVVAGEKRIFSSSGSYNEGIIYIFNNDGSLMPNWNPKRISDGITMNSPWCLAYKLDLPCGGFPSSPVLADINHDNKMEIILLSRYGKLYVFNDLGENLSGFPKLLGESFWFGNTFNTPAIADIDSDGQLEIVAALGDNNQPAEGTFVYAIKSNGTVVSGWPQKIVGDNPNAATYYSSLYCPPVVGDVNNDGYKEIFISSWNENGGTIHGWKYDGTPINNNWPVPAPGVLWNVSLGKTQNSEEPIIIAGAGSNVVSAVYAFSPRGNPLAGWPPQNSPQWSDGQPLVVDIDNDEDKELIFLSEIDSNVYAYERSGENSPTWPKNLFHTASYRTPFITDLDSDGYMDIIITGEDKRLHVKKLADIRATKPDWGSFQHDERHTGAYELPLIISTPTPAPSTLNGYVFLQGRPAPPNERWVIPLKATICGQEYSVNTDQSGNFTVNDLTAGTCDIRAKGSHTLANIKKNVVLNPEENQVDFGTLLEGDANNDNYITIMDFSILATGFNPNFDPRADFNQDGLVNIVDFSWLSTNFAKFGDIDVGKVAGTHTGDGPVQMSLKPASLSISQDESFSLEIEVVTGEQPIDAAAAYLNFDSTKLQIENIEASAIFTNILRNKFDNKTGQIDFAAGSFEDFPKGTFKLATVHFKAVSGAEENPTPIVFTSELPRQTEASCQGKSVLGKTNDGAVTIKSGGLCLGRQQGNLDCDANSVINETDLTILLDKWGEANLPDIETLFSHWKTF